MNRTERKEAKRQRKSAEVIEDLINYGLEYPLPLFNLTDEHRALAVDLGLLRPVIEVSLDDLPITFSDYAFVRVAEAHE